MNIFKRYIPHIVAILSFVVVSVFYFFPQYQGLDVPKGDDIHATGSKGGMLEYIEEYGENPGWSANLFSGMPSYLFFMDYQGRYLKDISDGFYFLGRPAAYYFLLMVGFWFMLLCFGISPYLAAVGAIGYALSSYFVIIYEAGHITKLMAMIYIAPLIGSIYLAYRKNLLLGASLAAAFTAIEISCSHPQITYYFLFVIAALVIAEGVHHYKSKEILSFWKKSGVLLIAAIIAVGANVVQLWYIADYSHDSTRGKSELTAQTSTNSANHTSGLDKDYITAWSYGKAETLNLFIPNLMGGSSTGGFEKDGQVAQSLKKYNAANMAQQLPPYWGPQPFTSGAVYIGAIFIFLAVFAIFVLNEWMKWWLVSVTLFSFFLAWGKNMMWLTDLFIDYFPLYNKFRTVSMILVIAQWSIPLMAILALDKVFKREIIQPKFNKALSYSLLISGGLALVLLLFGGSIFSFSGAQDAAMKLPQDVLVAMQNERASMLSADALRSLILVIATAALVWAQYNSKIKNGVAVALLATLVIVDLVGVDLRHLNYDHFTQKKEAAKITPTSADLAIMKDSDPNFRVANFAVSTFNDNTTSYFHKSVGGYHAAKLRRYQDIIDFYLQKGDMQIYNMLNTKYFIVNSKDKGLQVQLNDGAFGNCWFVDKIEFVGSADEEIAALGKVNLKDVAIVDDKFKSQFEGVELNRLTNDSTNVITLSNYVLNHLTYSTKSQDGGVALFSELFYDKGWSAYIDGEKVPHFRADYILRGLVIPSGEHTVEFKFEVPRFSTMRMITAICSIIIIVSLIAAVALTYRKKRE